MENMNETSVIESGNNTMADSKQKIKSIDLGIKREKIYFDEEKYLELNLSDFNIIDRYNNISKKLEEIENKFLEIPKEDKEKYINEIFDLDKELREIIDYVFDENVCEKVIGNSSVFAITDDGMLFFEKIFDSLIPLYEADLKVKSKKINKRISKYTDKYK